MDSKVSNEKHISRWVDQENSIHNQQNSNEDQQTFVKLSFRELFDWQVSCLRPFD